MAVKESMMGSAIVIGIDIAAAVVTGDVMGRRTEERENIVLAAEAGARSVVHTVMRG